MAFRRNEPRTGIALDNAPGTKATEAAPDEIQGRGNVIDLKGGLVARRQLEPLLIRKSEPW
ncbi:hypothetical protein OIE69_01700 [Actinacidiphila glaucinigra]|uniref:hypothetical protein n=1 Tax=Actinacidiphila glaucinigra TaxID=235986 RepID=UPI002DD93A9C|nr:hypothetical protein [Actinacidiphila glaucinigra]WSD57727.1 hypothetical protein OIE69_01700 [Actinacidiphila glaucinigra]